MFLQSFFDTSFNPRTIGGRFIPQKQSSGHDTNRTNSEKLWTATAFPNEFRNAVGRHSLSERIQGRCGPPQSFRTNSEKLWAATVFPNEFREAVGRHSLSERIQGRCEDATAF